MRQSVRYEKENNKIERKTSEKRDARDSTARAYITAERHDESTKNYRFYFGNVLNFYLLLFMWEIILFS